MFRLIKTQPRLVFVHTSPLRSYQWLPSGQLPCRSYRRSIDPSGIAHCLHSKHRRIPNYTSTSCQHIVNIFPPNLSLAAPTASKKCPSIERGTFFFHYSFITTNKNTGLYTLNSWWETGPPSWRSFFYFFVIKKLLWLILWTWTDYWIAVVR